MDNPLNDALLTKFQLQFQPQDIHMQIQLTEILFPKVVISFYFLVDWTLHK